MARSILYRGQVYSSANLIRLLRAAIERGPVYVTRDNGQRFRVYRVLMGCEGQAVLDTGNTTNEYCGERLDNGRDEIAF